MAGLGCRFLNNGYSVPKPIINVLGKPMVQQAVEKLGIKGSLIFCILKEHDDKYHIEDILVSLYPECKVVVIDSITEGPVCSCLSAKEHLNNDIPLIIANCDQYMIWNPKLFLDFIESTKPDGCVVTYRSRKTNNSYARIGENDLVDLIREKVVISKYSLNGIHYWRKGRFFVDSAEEMIRCNDRTKNEFYVAPTYNYMIGKNKKVSIFNLDENQHHAIGTPEDLNIFLEFIKSRNNENI